MRFHLIITILSALLTFSVADELSLTFRNEIEEPITVYWEDRSPDGKRIPQGEVAPGGGELRINAFAEHIFSYDHGGERHFIVATEEQDAFIVLLGVHKDVPVVCTATTDGGQETGQEFRIIVKPYWSPRGAAHFLDLVRLGYYNGAALNRVVPKFLTQFGISADFNMRTELRTRQIKDDPKPSNPDVPFQPGMMSYAGSGPNSRTTEIFFVMPGAPQSQLEYFGVNSWETPFAIVEGRVEDSPVATWFAYGDMPPNGEGPDPHKIYESDGYEYLARDFPKMDYMENCVIERTIVQEEL